MPSDAPVSAPDAWLNELPSHAARDALRRCCGSERWVEGMLLRRPFQSMGELLGVADAIWSDLGKEDFLQAFSHHPEIGVSLEVLRAKFAQTASLSLREQGLALSASESVLSELAAGNREYRARFGFSFIVCATGKSAEEMLGMLTARLQNDAESELRLAAAEQAKITRLRLEKLAA